MDKIIFRKKLVLLLLGFITLTFMGLNWYMAVAAWLAPIFLLRFTRRSGTGGFLLFLLTAIISGTISRTCNALTGHILEYILGGLYFGITFSLPFLADRLLYKKQKRFFTSLIFPVSFVLTEYLVSLHIGSWGNFAHTQYHIKQLIQVTSLFGLFGLSFLIVWFASVINWILEHKERISAFKKSVLIYGSIFLTVFIFGEIRMTLSSPGSNTVRVAGICCDFDFHKLFKDEFETIFQYTEGNLKEIPDRIFSDDASINKMLRNTIKASDQNAKIIVWNEISLIVSETQSEYLKDTLGAIASEYNCYILPAFLVGSNPKLGKPFRNTAYLITPDKKIAFEYSKSALHPQAEVPIIKAGDFEIPVFVSEYGKLGCVICYDMDFPYFINQAGKESVDIMLVPAYDWEGITPLHSYMASFEAIQNGFSLIRPNGKGLSAAYDSHGNILSQMNTFTSKEKIMFADVPNKSKSTLYSKTGNIFVYICLAGLLFFIVLKLFKKM